MVPSACVGKYQSAATVLPMNAPGISRRECPTCTPVTPLLAPGNNGSIAAAAASNAVGSGGAAATTGVPITAAAVTPWRVLATGATAGNAVTTSAPGRHPKADITPANNATAGAGAGRGTYAAGKAPARVAAARVCVTGVRCAPTTAAGAATCAAAGRAAAGRLGASNSTGLRAGSLTAAGTSARAADDVFRAARRDRSAPARTVVREAVGADRSADASLSATGSLVAPVAAPVARRGTVLAGADASARAADDAAPASDSAVSATATPAPEIKADPTPTTTAPVPNKARRLPIATKPFVTDCFRP